MMSSDDDSASDVCNVCTRFGGCVGLSSCDVWCGHLAVVVCCSVGAAAVGGSFFEGHWLA